MSAINIMLVAYQGGAPGNLIDPAMSWREVVDSEIASFDAPPSTLLVLHPGSEERFDAWMKWADARGGDVGILIVSSDPSFYQGHLDKLRAKGRAMDHVFVMPHALARLGGDNDEAALYFLREVALFVVHVQSMSGPLSRANIPKLWIHLDAANEARRLRQANLIWDASHILLAKRVSRDAAIAHSRRVGRGFKDVATSTKTFLELDAEIGHTLLPYSVDRHMMHHTKLTQRIMGILQSAGSTPAERAQAQADWRVASAECQTLAKQALVALNPDLLVRAAMFIADPLWTPTREQMIRREGWDKEAIAAAAGLIAEAQKSVSPDIESRVQKFRAACSAADAATTPEALLPELKNVAELLGGEMKVQHGAKAAA